MSYGLPHTTEVNRPFPKKQLFAKFGVKSAQRERFDADISRMVISHEISSRSIPALASGDITAIYVVSVMLKRKDFDTANIELVYKLIPQRMVMAITLDDKVQFAIHHERLFFTSWLPADTAAIPLNGLSLDEVWQNLVTTFGDFTIDDGNTLTEQIVADEQREKLQRQIATLENKMKKEKQPRRKFELHQQISELKKSTKRWVD
ncbi:MAG: DUF4391 domain-containing protein [Muribaculaceae bacterium]|nr:DUF4391 domain-containing protein [Muribaculaceae bacterium]